MENILIANKEKLETLKENFAKQGKDKIHILTDFDNTLTCAFVNGEKVPSIISVLRDGSYLTPDYAEKAHGLYDKYHPFENDPNILKEEKKRLMEEWWTVHFELLIKLGLNKKDVEKAIDSEKIKFRGGFFEFIDFLKEKNIPLIIMSSSGLGEESISLKLEKENKLYNNVYIISNSFKWDENGKAISIRTPIIHGANKDETLVKDFPEIFKAVKNRKNVLLIGDSLDDTGMVEGFDYDNLIKIGFLNEQTEEKLEKYEKVFDIILLNDSGMKYINKLISEIIL